MAKVFFLGDPQTFGFLVNEQELGRYEQPLLKVGIAIRRAFIEQAKQLYANKNGVLENVDDRNIFEARGNAARNADVLADVSLFRLGLVDPTEAITIAMNFVYYDIFKGGLIKYIA